MHYMIVCFFFILFASNLSESIKLFPERSFFICIFISVKDRHRTELRNSGWIWREQKWPTCSLLNVQRNGGRGCCTLMPNLEFPGMWAGVFTWLLSIRTSRVLLGKTLGWTTLFTLTIPQAFDFVVGSLSKLIWKSMSRYSEATESCHNGPREENSHNTTFALNI